MNLGQVSIAYTPAGHVSHGVGGDGPWMTFQSPESVDVCWTFHDVPSDWHGPALYPAGVHVDRHRFRLVAVKPLETMRRYREGLADVGTCEDHMDTGMDSNSAGAGSRYTRVPCASSGTLGTVYGVQAISEIEGWHPRLRSRQVDPSQQ